MGWNGKRIKTPNKLNLKVQDQVGKHWGSNKGVPYVQNLMGLAQVDFTKQTQHLNTESKK